jgi:hypothetical protein
MDAVATAANATTEPAAGLEDVVRAARTLARSTRDLGTDTARVAERELAMAIRIATGLRDQVISKETLAEARKNELASRLRQDAHDIVDLVMDAGAVSMITATRFFERFVDEGRPAITTGAAAGAPAGGRVIVGA